MSVLYVACLTPVTSPAPDYGLPPSAVCGALCEVTKLAPVMRFRCAHGHEFNADLRAVIKQLQVEREKLRAEQREAVAIDIEKSHAEVERSILAGQNRIVIPYALEPDRIHVYTVPRWRQHPVRRCRIAWARWRHRHPDAGTRLLEALRWCGAPWGLTR